MDLPTVFLVAIGLAMDATAVSVAGGVSVREGRARTALTLALIFGGFQAGMTVLGWYAGSALAGFIGWIDHWVAFFLLLFIGGKMVFDGLKGEDGEPVAFEKPLVLLTLGIATSIDAMAVGLSFAVLGSAVLVPAAIIGIVSAVLSLVGFWCGGVFGGKHREWAEVVGGAVLLFIGVRILFEHLFI